jgi:hypothetical protein
MFELLTTDELDELSTMLCNAIYDVRTWHDDTVSRGLLCDLRIAEHDVWHTRCAHTGIRCLQDVAA